MFQSCLNLSRISSAYVEQRRTLKTAVSNRSQLNSNELLKSMRSRVFTASANTLEWTTRLQGHCLAHLFSSGPEADNAVQKHCCSKTLLRSRLPVRWVKQWPAGLEWATPKLSIHDSYIYFMHICISYCKYLYMYDSVYMYAFLSKFHHNGSHQWLGWLMHIFPQHGKTYCLPFKRLAGTIGVSKSSFFRMTAFGL